MSKVGVRIKQFNAQDGLCFYCEGETWERSEGRNAARRRFGFKKGDRGSKLALTYRMATKEHLLKKEDGGGHGDNIVMSCFYCNIRRGDVPPEEHKRAMVALVEAGEHPVSQKLKAAA